MGSMTSYATPQKRGLICATIVSPPIFKFGQSLLLFFAMVIRHGLYFRLRRDPESTTLGARPPAPEISDQRGGVMSKRVSDEKRERIIKLAKEGVPSSQLCERTGVGQSSVRKICKDAGVKLASSYDGLRYLLTPKRRKVKQESDVADRSGNT